MGTELYYDPACCVGNAGNSLHLALRIDRDNKHTFHNNVSQW